MSEVLEEREFLPKLRFPQFRGKWSFVSLDTLYSFGRTYQIARDKLNNQSGPAQIIHYGDIHTRYPSHVDFGTIPAPYLNDAFGQLINIEENIAVGDLVFADASEDLCDVGKAIEVIGLPNIPILAGMHTIFARRRKSVPEIGFGGFYIRSGLAQAQIRHEAHGTKVYGVSSTRLAKIKVAVPVSKAEQRKIAECLESLDELIAAETEKLETLKRHKKGLLQQLFPVVGETTPRLRFPQFRGAAAWQVRTLGSLVTLSSGGTPPRATSEYWSGEIPWVSAESMHCLRITDSKSRVTAKAIQDGTPVAPKGSLLVLVRGMMLFRRIPISIADRDVAFNQDVKCLQPIDSDSQFLLYALLSKESQISVDQAGHGTGKINTDELESLQIEIPTQAEEHCIATIFCSLEEKIVESAKILNRHRSHKSALMQQLFPSLEELDATTE